MKAIFENLNKGARHLKRETYTLYLAYRDPRTPWFAKAFSALVVAYALSPLDLIPDFIPVLGYLDDLVLVPLGIYFAVKMIPADIYQEAREQAVRVESEDHPNSGWVVALILLIWLGAFVLTGWWIADLIKADSDLR